MSYVRFCSSGELVSASTDSTLRLWGLEGPAGTVPTAAGSGGGDGGTSADALRVYEGHSNEKNFVGLAGRLPGLLPCWTGRQVAIAGRR